ncbi:MAG TPA: SHOCT domain-containing protein, partial [Thermoanaerobaculia bacterium]|nr:SHOCT domain-containing protein [Thermoanaerobaculia bacterium]
SNSKVAAEAMAECNKAWASAQSKGIGKKLASPAPQKTATATGGGKVSAPPSTAPSTEERLRKLDDLKKKNLISEEEYARKRKEILDGV